MHSRFHAVLVASLAAVALTWPAAPKASAQRTPAFQIGQARPQKNIRPAPQGRPRGKKGPGEGQGPRAGGGLNDTVLRLMQLPPERRREVLRSSPRLRNMPARQRNELLSRLDRIDRMSVNERELLMQRYQLFSRLRPEQQSQARALYRRWAAQPSGRRALMTRGIQRLRRMSVEDRAKALESEGFTSRFSESELEMLGELVELTDDRR